MKSSKVNAYIKSVCNKMSAKGGGIITNHLTALFFPYF